MGEQLILLYTWNMRIFIPDNIKPFQFIEYLHPFPVTTYKIVFHQISLLAGRAKFNKWVFPDFLNLKNWSSVNSRLAHWAMSTVQCTLYSDHLNKRDFTIEEQSPLQGLSLLAESLFTLSLLTKVLELGKGLTIWIPLKGRGVW